MHQRWKRATSGLHAGCSKVYLVTTLYAMKIYVMAYRRKFLKMNKESYITSPSFRVSTKKSFALTKTHITASFGVCSSHALNYSLHLNSAVILYEKKMNLDLE